MGVMGVGGGVKESPRAPPAPLPPHAGTDVREAGEPRKNP